MTIGASVSDVCPVSRQTYREDFACALLQATCLLVFVAGVAVLISLAGVFGNAWQVVSFSIYGATLILAYLSSALYHFTRHLGRKRVFKVMDHANIHLLIAGTYTPFTLVTLHGGWGWSLFGVVWGLAIIGVLLTVLYPRRYSAVAVAVYLAMGWLGLLAAVPLVERMPGDGLLWLVLGGAAYSGGVGFYLWERLRFNHLVWQVFVLAGSACFYFVMIFYVLFPPAG